ncbi:MAG: NAD(P)/FAD-dependent oxidoreductase [Burkholderiales bacterium]|nr:NAD(P)/FAD-dependent oxidoreductase [Burkholderiales bacterium]
MNVDALIIGAGHNGLTAACYLARAGLSVRVLEARHVVGGAAVTEEFHPGYRNSVASYTVSLLHPKVIADLRLAEHGLRVVFRPMSNFLPLPDGDALGVGPELADTVAEVRRFSAADAQRLPDYYAMLERLADALRALVLVTPPDPNAGIGGLLDTLKTARRLHGLPVAAQRDLVELFGRSAGEILDDWFESAPIKAALGFDSIVGAYASPYAPGSGYVQLHHCFGEVNGRKGAWGHAIGGMGAITQAMRAEAVRLGVQISVDAAVARVKVRAGRAGGVVLASGDEIDARLVVAGVGPKLLYNRLIAPEHLDGEVRQRIERFKTGSGVLRMNVALSELPDFCGRGSVPQAHHGAGIIVAPSLDYMERAHVEARAHGMSRSPVVEVLIPSTLDDSLAPPGAHVASLFCQYFAPQLPDGRSWDDARDAAADLAIDAVTRVAPNFRRSIVARQVLTPLDLERTFGLSDGDIFHGRLSLEQLFSSRPMLGYADYRTPIRGLYLCGSGAHPGGGVTGVPGHNAAREILRDLRRRRV